MMSTLAAPTRAPLTPAGPARRDVTCMAKKKGACRRARGCNAPVWGRERRESGGPGGAAEPDRKRRPNAPSVDVRRAPRPPPFPPAFSPPDAAHKQAASVWWRAGGRQGCGARQRAPRERRAGASTGKGVGRWRHLHTHTPRLTTPPHPPHTHFSGIRCIVTLECTEARALGETPTRYTTQKNRKNTPERIELKKYNKHLKRHTVHKEIK